MKKNLPLIGITIFLSAKTFSQNDPFAYAITDETKEGTSWKVLRKIDLRTGEYSNVLFHGTDAKSISFDAFTKKELIKNSNSSHLPFTTGVAAIALDKKQNRLFFSPMFLHQLRYLDLNTMKVYSLTNQAMSKDPEKKDGGKTFSRMAISPEGVGYAISNDAEEFIQFSTDKNPAVRQLGRIVDAPSNKNNSIHNSCTCYGGDIVCDDKGSIYLVTGLNYVFKIDPATRVATHLGIIKGLPANFTTSAAVVHTDGQILITSAAGSFASFLVDPKTWTATAYNNGAPAFHTADLANSNYISTKPKPVFTAIDSKTKNTFNNIQIFPNPVLDNRNFTVQFSNVSNGTYYLQLIDLTGQPVFSRRITINAKTNIQAIPFAINHANGIYMVRVVNDARTTVFEQKLIVQ